MRVQRVRFPCRASAIALSELPPIAEVWGSRRLKALTHALESACYRTERDPAPKARLWLGALRRFEHDAVSRGDRGDHRHQRQVHGVVPRRDDPDHTERLILDAIAAEPHVQGDVAAGRAHEATE